MRFKSITNPINVTAVIHMQNTKTGEHFRYALFRNKKKYSPEKLNTQLKNCLEKLPFYNDKTMILTKDYIELLDRKKNSVGSFKITFLNN